MTITVHHLEYSRSLRILWLLEELSLPYEIEHHKRDKDFRAGASLAAVHPLGRAPVVEVDGHVLAESGAVIEYFVEREHKLRPEGEQALLDYRFFMHYAEGSAMTPLLVQLIVQKLQSAPVPFFVKPVVKGIAGKIEGGFSGPAIKLHFDYINTALGEREYFAGDAFSAADIQMFYAVEGALTRGGGKWPHMRAWRERVTARPAYVEAEKKGGAAMPPSTKRA